MSEWNDTGKKEYKKLSIWRKSSCGRKQKKQECMTPILTWPVLDHCESVVFQHRKTTFKFKAASLVHAPLTKQASADSPYVVNREAWQTFGKERSGRHCVSCSRHCGGRGMADTVEVEVW